MSGTKKDKEPEITPEQLVVDALNEQGYLLHHKVLDVLRSHSAQERPNHRWQVEASEVPVSLPNGDETRIDLVLRHGEHEKSLWRAVVECKRSAKDFKRWVFFGQNEFDTGPSPRQYFYHKTTFQNAGHRSELQIDHWVDRCPSIPDCPVFDYAVEVKLSPPGREKRVSATEAIESACDQVTLGLSGLALRLAAADHRTYRLIPIVVTTAELMTLDFSVKAVPIQSGTLKADDVTLKPVRWLAIHHRVRDAVSSLPQKVSTKVIDVGWSLAQKHVRTVFIVQTPYIHDFLTWSQTHLPLKQ